MDEILEFSVDAKGYVYTEGTVEAAKTGPNDEGWFCMEFETEDEARDELLELGFSNEDIDAVREA